MNISRFKALLGATALTIVAASTAQAGGFDRGGVSIDLLFDESRFATEASVTHVSPQRKLNNVQRLDSPPYPVALYSPSVAVDDSYTVPRLGAKVNIVEPVDCLATYTEPYGASADYGTGNAYSPTTTEFNVKTRDYGLTCSYKAQVGRGFARVIGGVSYQEVEAFQSRQTLLAFGNTGLGKFNMSDSAWSWRLGASYEIPEIAFRASLVYSAAYDLDLIGTVDRSGFAGGPLGNFTSSLPVSATTEIPQALEFKLQTGIAPGWLAFGSVRWQEWSKLGVIPINGVRSPINNAVSSTSFDPLYRDGWTVTGGIGHSFNDQLSGAVSLTWDRGTSTTSGYQTDLWNFGAGGSYKVNQNIEIRLGGSLGIWTSGSSTFAAGDTANAVTYTFGNDLVLAGAGSIKVKF